MLKLKLNHFFIKSYFPFLMKYFVLAILIFIPYISPELIIIALLMMLNIILKK